MIGHNLGHLHGNGSTQTVCELYVMKIKRSETEVNFNTVAVLIHNLGGYHSDNFSTSSTQHVHGYF